MYFPNFTITNKILKNIGLIEACREVIINAPLVPAWEAKFREEAIIRTVHYGTHIEGNELNLTQAVRVMEGKAVLARERDIQEVINYRNVLNYIDGLQKKDKDFKITESIIKHLHKLTVEKILPKEECGEYRTKKVVIKNSQTGEITFAPPPFIEVPYLLESFINWLGGPPAKDLHPVLKAGIIHYELARVHPFLDGNGRVARAAAIMALFREGYDVKRFFSLEEHYDRDAIGYYGALKSAESGDLTLWLEYFIEGLAQELAKIKEKVQNLSVDLKLKEKMGGRQVALTSRQIKILEYIQGAGFLQNKAFKDLFPMISEDSVLRDLQDLIKKGILKKTGVTKASKYVLKTTL
ncbi:Fic family protein [Candidatus Microgenomates bacterium]|nr:Fic family protein [Candidatus Microgenomates bacterium]